MFAALGARSITAKGQQVLLPEELALVSETSGEVESMKFAEGRERGEGRMRGSRGDVRSQRIFGHGELRLVLLMHLVEKASHGYELIKAIEEQLHGAYVPSPGVIYPTLAWLEEMELIEGEVQPDGRNLYRATREGRAYLKLHKVRVDQLGVRIQAAVERHGRPDSPELMRAMDALKLALRRRFAAAEVKRDELDLMVKVLQEATRKIEAS
jgi:DNA-binding PadR family transcriptional regulator